MLRLKLPVCDMVIHKIIRMWNSHTQYHSYVMSSYTKSPVCYDIVLTKITRMLFGHVQNYPYVESSR